MTNNKAITGFTIDAMELLKMTESEEH